MITLLSDCGENGQDIDKAKELSLHTRVRRRKLDDFCVPKIAAPDGHSAGLKDLLSDSLGSCF
jgi:hypothetical protein